ncbi:glutathione S-transferase [Athelia psychrophila]|uniref:Glutathione S-transferase n=1 Tax=Athelia psychrophila TaxID=1759441 RepID=A0A166W909_9AGAM|nr:glutathione S-transferase [Fibularhizoctonia sp. CBS 109695]
MSTAEPAIVRQKPLILYTGKTPNGYQASILLEELRAVYGSSIDYEVYKINFSKKEHKEPWFLKINPNGQVPAHYDKERKFTFDPNTQAQEYSEMMQWIFFGHGGLVPMHTQAYHFKRLAEKIPYAQIRYMDEARRLHGVLQIRLENRKYLAGAGEGSFSIADIKIAPWMNTWRSAMGVESLDEWPDVKAWVDRCMERPGVHAGIQVPA